jgi:hypothetical protein
VAAKSQIFSSVKPGVVQIQPMGMMRPAAMPTSSPSSRAAQVSGVSPGSSLPAGTMLSTTRPAPRYRRATRCTSAGVTARRRAISVRYAIGSPSNTCPSASTSARAKRDSSPVMVPTTA